MKIAAIALASAAVIGLAQPSFAQQYMNRDQSDRPDQWQHGSGLQHQFQYEDEQSSTSGQGGHWSDRDDRRDHNTSDDRDYGHEHEWSRRGNMEGRMGSMWRMHERMAHANEGAAHFRLRRGQAAIDVRCPQGESLQACVNATGQLLDKIANLREPNAQGATSGSALGSGETNTLPQPGASFPNQLNQRGSGNSESER